jgi:hypothetical protein
MAAPAPVVRLAAGNMMCPAPAPMHRMRMAAGGEMSDAQLIAKLAQIGAQMIGSEGCGWCKKQLSEHADLKKFFKDGSKGDHKTSDGKSVQGFPTWDFKKGNVQSGFKTLKQLKEAVANL